jgi:zeaxanthin glucosyltransferase
MANVVIAPLYWQANINVTFALAKKLRSRGHRVCYACIHDTEARIRSQGFDFVPVFSSVFPPGTLAAQSANEAAGKYLGATGVNGRIKAMCELCRDGEIRKATRDFHPGLFLVSNHMPWVGIDAWKSGAPVMMFSSIIVSAPDSMAPPLSSFTIPSSTLLSRLKVLLEWRMAGLKRKLRASISGLWRSSAYIKNLAVALGYPLSGIDFTIAPWPRLSFPELVFLPECFDFPRAAPIKNFFYAEPSVDTERKDKDFPWEKLDGRPLIYCSLGSIVTFKYFAASRRFFQALLDAMKQRPDLQAVVAIGNHLKKEDFTCPENVILADEAPQVALLQRAALMVGHGGTGCLRESMFYGVPLVLCPLGFDAPGNTARALHHGVAVRADFQRVSATELQTAINKVLSDPSYSEAAKRMSRRFMEWQDQAPSIDVIESVLAGKSNLHQCA